MRLADRAVMDAGNPIQVDLVRVREWSSKFVTYLFPCKPIELLTLTPLYTVKNDCATILSQVMKHAVEVIASGIDRPLANLLRITRVDRMRRSHNNRVDAVFNSPFNDVLLETNERFLCEILWPWGNFQPRVARHPCILSKAFDLL